LTRPETLSDNNTTSALGLFPQEMETTRQSFKRLDVVIDDLHSLFEEWEREGALLSHLDEDTIH
jgi:hypothetical protein